MMMLFTLPIGENGSSRESLANLLDEGLGTSLDGTDEISSSIHPTLGRNDSGKSNFFDMFYSVLFQVKVQLVL